MKVLIADKLPSSSVQALEALGLSTSLRPELTADELPSVIAGVHVLVVRSTRVTAATFEAADALQLVIRAGAGTNTIDCDAAAEGAIHVANCPGKNAVAVAELTMGLAIALDRRIPDNVASMRAGRWEKGVYGKGGGLLGKTFGVAGMGRIGQEVASRARAFGMKVLAYDPYFSEERAEELGVKLVTTVPELCAGSNVISVHVPKTDATTHLFDAKAFSQMRPGTFFIHMARGGVVDDQAMADAVARGHIRAAADVFESEPKGSSAEYDGLFRDVEGFYGTHHIGASTTQSELDTGMEAVRIVEAFSNGAPLPNCVNVRTTPKDSPSIVVRHEDRVGVLAGVFKTLKEAGISVQEMENSVFEGAEAASARIVCDKCPSGEQLLRIEGCDGVFAARLSS